MASVGYKWKKKQKKQSTTADECDMKDIIFQCVDFDAEHEKKLTPGPKLLSVSLEMS